METITHTLQSASNAIWNEVQALQSGGKQHDQAPEETEQRQIQGEEPIAGIQGKGTATDPYDAGNREDQPGAPESKENTAVITEPLVSIMPPVSQTHPAHPTTDRELRATDTDTSGGIGPGNPVVDEPVSVQREVDAIRVVGKFPEDEFVQDTTVISKEDTSKKDTSKEYAARDEGTSTVGGDISKEYTTRDKDTKDEGTSTKPEPEAEPEPLHTPTSTPVNTQSEQRTQSPTQKEPVSGESSSAGVTTATSPESHDRHKQKVSEEALKGPKCPPPREPYQFEKKLEEHQAKKEEGEEHTNEPKLGGLGGGSSPSEPKESAHHAEHDSHAKETEPHHHKSMKERLRGVTHRVGHHLHHSD